MILSWSAIVPLLLLAVPALGHKQHTDNELVVQAPSGTYIGLINGTTPNVRQFRSIPYAAAPVGERRWLPPTKPEANSSTTYDATQFPLSCPQFVSRPPSVFNQDVPGWLIYTDGQNSTAGESAGETSEDCLHLAVWTPTGRPEKLPVVMFMTGGSFLTGGVNIPYQLPHHWVERTGAHIVVTIKCYRLNIFGFPNAAGLDDQNLGILDQRMALEWVRDNIEAFGGDADKITLWGQSAGAAATDYHNFAYADDPIVKGYYASSGSAFLNLTVPIEPSNFTFVATHFNCAGPPAAELDCLRKIPSADIEAFIGTYRDNSTLVAPTQPTLNFYPVQDNKIIFADYADRYARAAFSKLPLVYSTTTNEGVVTGGIFGPFPPTNQTLNEQITRALFICPAALSTVARTTTTTTGPDVLTYRVEFAGNFTDVSPKPYLGAYHDADLAMLFGTYVDFPGASTEYEGAVAESMQDHLLAFMRDPVDGPARLGWGSARADQLLRYGRDGRVVEAVGVGDVDGVCA
ncbi:alpha/beta-hydrolase [Pseudovirgaria hyperparasitica]|uniref:Carboxylic ester hydrolase n=1 Tax=Pseudovirgaria hyperparasitica TaxID=470096 RepID=A0A6A6WBH6_9PEZI|nr:alpha/beta-hydrolase [Pseudovirgaria hyperparasitica]KAF2759529.1 alpha/beta-hydrolase [Pseudovirgaria hyperparasitica]